MSRVIREGEKFRDAVDITLAVGPIQSFLKCFTSWKSLASTPNFLAAASILFFASCGWHLSVITWSKRAMAFLTCAASLIGSFLSMGHAYAESGSFSLFSVVSLAIVLNLTWRTELYIQE